MEMDMYEVYNLQLLDDKLCDLKEANKQTEIYNITITDDEFDALKKLLRIIKFKPTTRELRSL